MYTGRRLSGAGTLTVEVVGRKVYCGSPKRQWTTAITIIVGSATASLAGSRRAIVKSDHMLESLVNPTLPIKGDNAFGADNQQERLCSIQSTWIQIRKQKYLKLYSNNNSTAKESISVTSLLVSLMEKVVSVLRSLNILFIKLDGWSIRYFRCISMKITDMS